MGSHRLRRAVARTTTSAGAYEPAASQGAEAVLAATRWQAFDPLRAYCESSLLNALGRVRGRLLQIKRKRAQQSAMKRLCSQRLPQVVSTKIQDKPGVFYQMTHTDRVRKLDRNSEKAAQARFTYDFSPMSVVVKDTALLPRLRGRKRSRPAVDLEVCGSQNLHMSRPGRLCPKAPGVSFIKASPRRSSCELHWLPPETPALQGGSPCSACSVPPVDSFATRLAASLARALVEHFGSLDRAFAALAHAGTGLLRRDDWLRELQPLQESARDSFREDQIEDIGPSLGKFFAMIQAVGVAHLDVDVVTCDDWHSFFYQCLVGSHAERLLDQDLGPRRRSCQPQRCPPAPAAGDCGEDI
eukprot:s3278_g4.t1